MAETAATEGPPCAVCAATAVAQCSACKWTYYCGTDCQKIHWKRGRHRRDCAAIGARKRAAFNTPANRERLIQAAERGDEAAVFFLTVRGADVNHWDARCDATPLYIAAQNGHDAVVRVLLDAGADKDLAANDGCTPLFIAAQNGHDAVVRALLDAGADKDLARNDGTTPLMIATQMGHTAIVRMLNPETRPECSVS